VDEAPCNFPISFFIPRVEVHHEQFLVSIPIIKGGREGGDLRGFGVIALSFNERNHIF
jgi:hypothetical protein